MDTPVIQVAIALVVIFSFLSIVVSAACELVAALCGWRSHYLWAGIDELLQDPEVARIMREHPALKSLAPEAPLPARAFRRMVPWYPRRGAPYVPPSRFAEALVETVRAPNEVPPDLESAITDIIEGAEVGPSRVVEATRAVVSRVATEDRLRHLAPAVSLLSRRVFAEVDPSVRADLRSSIEAAILEHPSRTSTLALLAPVVDSSERLRSSLMVASNEQSDCGSVAAENTLDPLTETRHTYVAIYQAFAHAIAQIPINSIEARDRQLALRKVLEAFRLGSPAYIAGEWRDLLQKSRSLRHSITALRSSSPKLAEALAPLAERSKDDGQAFRVEVERWFDDAMIRVSGRYKKHTLFWQAGVGLSLAVLLNVDALQITRSLWYDSTVRQVLIEQVKGASKGDAPTGNYETLISAIGTLGLPIGWRRCAPAPSAMYPGPVQLGTAPLWCEDGWSWLGLPTMLLGWLVTAVAVSLGAPFWFDTLKLFMSVRSSGKSSESRRAN